MSNFKHGVEAVMALYKEVYKDIQKQAEQSRLTSFATDSSLSPLPYIQSFRQPLSRDTDVISLNTNPNVCMFISY